MECMALTWWRGPHGEERGRARECVCVSVCVYVCDYESERDG